MARKKKRPWNADLKTPGLLDVPETPPPKPLPGTRDLGHSTPGGPESEWQCLRCERLKIGNDPAGLDHAPRCRFRDTGEDPPVEN